MQAFPNQLSVYHPSAVPLESRLWPRLGVVERVNTWRGLVGKPGQYLTSWVTDIFMVNMIQ